MFIKYGLLILKAFHICKTFTCICNTTAVKFTKRANKIKPLICMYMLMASQYVHIVCNNVS